MDRFHTADDWPAPIEHNGAVRLTKHGVVHGFQKYVGNPLVRRIAGGRLAPPGLVLLETVGRKSGVARRVPVGSTLDGDTLWIVSEHGRRSGYGRNIEAHPGVRVKIAGKWRAGTAQFLDDDDPTERLRAARSRANAAAVRALGTNLTTLRVDLEP
jgi:deazaflavin-dependent oxidoreductase (nitroreductase family)